MVRKEQAEMASAKEDYSLFYCLILPFHKEMLYPTSVFTHYIPKVSFNASNFINFTY